MIEEQISPYRAWKDKLILNRFGNPFSSHTNLTRMMRQKGIKPNRHQRYYVTKKWIEDVNNEVLKSLGK